VTNLDATNGGLHSQAKYREELGGADREGAEDEEGFYDNSEIGAGRKQESEMARYNNHGLRNEGLLPDISQKSGSYLNG